MNKNNKNNNNKVKYIYILYFVLFIFLNVCSLNNLKYKKNFEINCSKLF